MGIRSTEDWSTISVNGIILGQPAPLNAVYDEDGNLVSSDGNVWDGGVPSGELDNNLMLQPDGEDEDGNPLPPVDLAATGAADMVSWEQPEGAHDAYPEGLIVSHGGNAWKSLVDANVWEPGVSGWRQINDSGTPLPWVQPTGAHDAYNTGDLVTHVGKTWRSTVDANVWEPGVYGWEEVV